MDLQDKERQYREGLHTFPQFHPNFHCAMQKTVLHWHSACVWFSAIMSCVYLCEHITAVKIQSMPITMQIPLSYSYSHPSPTD